LKPLEEVKTSHLFSFLSTLWIGLEFGSFSKQAVGVNLTGGNHPQPRDVRNLHGAATGAEEPEIKAAHAFWGGAALRREERKR
jgi:hypothetical protein